HPAARTGLTAASPARVAHFAPAANGRVIAGGSPAAGTGEQTRRGQGTKPAPERQAHDLVESRTCPRKRPDAAVAAWRHINPQLLAVTHHAARRQRRLALNIGTTRTGGVAAALSEVFEVLIEVVELAGGH